MSVQAARAAWANLSAPALPAWFAPALFDASTSSSVSSSASSVAPRPSLGQALLAAWTAPATAPSSPPPSAAHTALLRFLRHHTPNRPVPARDELRAAECAIGAAVLHAAEATAWATTVLHCIEAQFMPPPAESESVSASAASASASGEAASEAVTAWVAKCVSWLCASAVPLSAASSASSSSSSTGGLGLNFSAAQPLQPSQAVSLAGLAPAPAFAIGGHLRALRRLWQNSVHPFLPEVRAAL
jgi:hypothetical protein